MGNAYIVKHGRKNGRAKVVRLFDEEQKKARERAKDKALEALGNPDCRYSDIEDIFLGNGLEMDHFEQMFI